MSMADYANELMVAILGEDRSGPAYESAKNNAQSFADQMGEVSNDVIAKVTEMVAGFLTLEKAVESAVEGIHKADEIRDLQASLAAFTGSTEKATQALEYFRASAANTRHTAAELADVFRDLLPQAMSRGFTQQSTEQITVMLSQLATVAGKSLDEMESSFRMLLSGRAMAGRNPLLSVLGITSRDIKDLRWDEVIDKMQEVASHFSGMGQSFESTMHSIKSALFDAFGEGFNEAMGNSRDAYDGLKKELTDPDFLTAIKSIGGAVADFVKTLRDLITAYNDLRNMGGGKPTSTVQKVADAIGGVAYDSTQVTPVMGRAGLGLVPGGTQGGADAIAAMQASLRAQIAQAAYDAETRKIMSGRGYAEQAGIENVSNYGGTVQDFFKQVDTDLTAHKDKAKQIIAELKTVVEDNGVVSWEDYNSVIHGVDETTSRVTNSLHKNAEGLGKVRTEIEKAISAWAELAKLMGDHGVVGNLNANAGQQSYEDFAPGPGSAGTPWWFDQDFGLLGSNPNNTLVSTFAPKQYGFTADMMTPADPAAAYAKQFTDAVIAGDAFVRAGKQFSDEANDQMRQEFASQLGYDLAAMFRGGGKSFMEALASDFPHLMGEAAQKFTDVLFGKPAVTAVDPVTGETKVLQGATGGLFGAAGAKWGKAALGFGTIGASGYEAGLSGTPGSRTSGVISGAITGAELLAETGYGAILGAVVGALVGLIGGAIGAAQRQKDYKYGVPVIDQYGNVTIDKPKNLTDAAIQQMQGQVSDTYDQYRNSYTRAAMTLGVSSANMPNFGQIVGQFQPNPSGHYQENFQQWLTQDLPRTIAGTFKDELKTGFASVGLNDKQFESMWTKYQGMDPAKVAQMIQDLASALSGINEATGYFGQSASGKLTGAYATSRQTFAQSLAEGDTKILDFAAHLKDLVGDDQIKAAGELQTMLKQRMDNEKQFEASLAQALKDATRQAEDLNNQFSLRMMHDASGKPDVAAQSRFLQGLANQDLAHIQGATNAAEAQSFWQDFLKVLDQISQLGYSVNPATGDQMTKWAQQQLGMGQNVFNAVIKGFGDAAAAQDKQFMAALDPDLTDFKNTLGGANVTIGDFGTATSNAAASLDGLSGSAAKLQKVFDAMASSAARSGFADRTAASRLSA